MVYYPFHFVEKKFDSWTCSEELQGLTSCTHTVYALLEDSIEKIVLRWNEYFLCSYMGPNHERIMDKMASRLRVWPQVNFIKKKNRYIYSWILCLCFCCGSTICHWWRFCLFAVNILNFSRPRLIKLSKIKKQL